MPLLLLSSLWNPKAAVIPYSPNLLFISLFKQFKRNSKKKKKKKEIPERQIDTALVMM